MKAKDIKPKLSFDQRAPYLENRLLFVPTFYNAHKEFSMPCFQDPEIFNRPMPIHIEFCSGNGEWVVEAASENPEIGWVAVEMKFARVRKIYAKAHTLGLKNLLVVWGKGEDFINHYLEEGSIDKVFIHFPDPWPKQRHAKHRIVQKDFIASIKRVLKPKGSLHLITDDLGYRDQMIDVVRFDFLSMDQELFVTRDKEFHSYFYRLWKSLDKKIFSLNYTKKQAQQIHVDISHSAKIDYDDLRLQANSFVEGGFKLFWVFDFRLGAHELPLLNKALFSSYQLTLQDLSDNVLDQFQEDTEGYRLFDSVLDFDSIATLDIQGQAAFDGYISDYSSYFSKYPKMLFYHFFLNTFVDFLSCLGSYLPLEPRRFLRLDLRSQLSKAEFVDLFSKRNFEDFDLNVSRAHVPSQRLLTANVESCYERALIIPSLDLIDYVKFEDHIKALEASGLEFCMIPEEHLVDSWYGLEHIYVLKGFLTDVGLRAIEGFKASMGKVHYL